MANVPLFSVTNQYTSSISCTFKLQVLFRIKHTCTASTLLFYMFILTSLRSFPCGRNWQPSPSRHSLVKTPRSSLRNTFGFASLR